MYTDPSLPRWIDGWRSPRLGLEMPIACYGDFGRPLLMFPTAAADFLENERFWLIKSIEHHIFAGKVRVFCVESINKHSWMNDSLPIPEKARRQMLYARYIEEEVVPFVRTQVRDPSARLATCGASFGGFHAANQFFRRPDLFDTVIAMSGFYDLEPSYTFDCRDDNVYFNNPVAYVANMAEGPTLDLLRHHSSINILTGQGRWEAPNRSTQLAGVLGNKGIGHNLDMWGFDVDHDWPWWRKMLDHYIGERLGW